MRTWRGSLPFSAEPRRASRRRRPGPPRRWPSRRPRAAPGPRAPGSRRTRASSTASAESVAAWSSSESPSRRLPSAAVARIRSAPGVTRIFSAAATFESCSAISAVVSARKAKRWQRDTIVGGILCSSVEARMKRACGGGSSSVFRSALNASVVSMWTSSMIGDPEAVALRRVADRLDQLARVLDLAVGGAVDLVDVEGLAAREDLPARGAFAAGLRRRALLAVERPREEARRRGLADSSRPRQEVRGRHAVLGDRVGEGARDRLLADQVVEPARAPFSG